MLLEQQSTAVGFCVTINAAFLQEVKEANCQLWDTLFQLRLVSQMAQPGEAKIHQWVQKLTEFRRQLSAEFALEETYGYISRAIRQHIACRVDPADTLKQHKDLYLHIIDICEQAEQAQYVGTVVRDFGMHAAAFLEFDLMLSEHERAESEMIRYGLGLRSE
jgi:hypothetical protein